MHNNANLSNQFDIKHIQILAKKNLIASKAGKFASHFISLSTNEWLFGFRSDRNHANHTRLAACIEWSILITYTPNMNLLN